MGLANVIPIFLDYKSGWDKNQVELINKIAKNLRASFESKSKQKTKEKPQVKKFTVSKYNRVLNLSDYFYDNKFSINFILDPAGFEVGIKYPLLEIENVPSYFEYEGSNDDEAPYKLLGNLGTITIETINNSPHFVFTPKEEWPEDESHNKLKYNCYIGGTYNG